MCKLVRWIDCGQGYKVEGNQEFHFGHVYVRCLSMSISCDVDRWIYKSRVQKRGLG